MIVGFDPGTTSALAAVDLNGSLQFTEEFRGGVTQAVKILGKRGRPSVVASDKSSLPAVTKLAAAFGAVSFFPKRDLTIEEKARLVRPYGLKSQHEKDALAAALAAHRKYKGLVRRVRGKEKEIFEMLLKGEVPNISRALARRSEKPRKRKKETDLKRRVDDLQRRLRVAETLLRDRGKPAEPAKRGRTRRVLSDSSKQEREARLRLEKELAGAHSRIAGIEAELGKLKESKPKEKEDIRRRIMNMIREYKERFRK